MALWQCQASKGIRRQPYQDTVRPYPIIMLADDACRDVRESRILVQYRSRTYPLLVLVLVQIIANAADSQKARYS